MVGVADPGIDVRDRFLCLQLIDVEDLILVQNAQMDRFVQSRLQIPQVRICDFDDVQIRQPVVRVADQRAA
ncbi:hypothetical protein SDC9_97878 [bioreactor metagenome]|uniref:Uncharacterized protein n=1 Tax=bioreactor metagenome TaxID=1076179 RepID=A0A645AFS8_9ZZZZ